ncbi:MAG TPA: transketolase C-terminal domain-containing protein [Burkholderiales bacterium]|nr:transketolase C-terminal domain-containing protein [Burkholderiales bacterium]
MDTPDRYELLPVHEREIVRAPFDAISVQICAENAEVIILTADLAPYTDIYRLPKEKPRQFLDVGMAEQNLMCIAGGLAKTGFMPIATTFACYATRRAFDQMVMSLGTGPSRGVVVGFAPGIASAARVHHQATDDLAMMRAVPGACVIDPADPTELMEALRAAIDHRGLVYLRGLRGEVSTLFKPGLRFEIGRARALREQGGVGIISTGYGTQWAVECSDVLQQRGVAHSLLHVPVLKPAPVQDIAVFCSRHRSVFTLENHNIIGGLGSLVAEVIATEGVPARLHRAGISDRWAVNGDMRYIRDQLGLSAVQLAAQVEALECSDQK